MAKLEGSAKEKRVQAKKNFDASIEKFKKRLGIIRDDGRQPTRQETYKKQKEGVQNYFKDKNINTAKTSVVKNTVGRMSPSDKVGPKHLGRADSLDTSGSLKVKPAKNLISKQTEVPSIHKSSPKPPSTKPSVRTTSPDKGGLKVSNKTPVTGGLSGKTMDMHDQARSMIVRPTSTEELLKRKK